MSRLLDKDAYISDTYIYVRAYIYLISNTVYDI